MKYQNITYVLVALTALAVLSISINSYIEWAIESKETQFPPTPLTLKDGTTIKSCNTDCPFWANCELVKGRFCKIDSAKK